MCGILGSYAYGGGSSVERTIFEDALSSLAHRGPDDKGIYESPKIKFGHRRLSIIDTSNLGRQPMSSPDKKVWLVYNGEIYNFKELKHSLVEKGHSFVSNTDTEVVLNSYLEWGIECIKLFNGMFAFAIWDSRNNRLFAARDPIGIKPFYYSDYNKNFFFASEISALLKIPHIPQEPDPTGIDDFFTFSYIPAPKTGFKHIKQLRPAHYLLLESGKFKNVQYWDLPTEAEKANLSEEECIEGLDSVLASAVKRQMVSDVPLGAFLSSGTDSFAIARAMKKFSDREMKLFSIGFDNKKYNELDYTLIAANALGTELISEKYNSSSFDAMEKIAVHCRDPFADSSCIPMYILCELASKHVKVALSGDGADELLIGYPTYKIENAVKLYKAIPDFIRKGMLKPLAYSMPEWGGKYSLREKATRFVYGAEKVKWYRHSSWRTIMTKEVKRQIYSPDFWKEVKDYDAHEEHVSFMKKANSHGCSDLESCLYSDFKFYLPNDMLVKVDRMSMAHSLELRVPFLDMEVVDFCWRIPEKFKLKNGQLKYVLRKVIGDLYPESLNKLPKSGFNVAPCKDLIPAHLYKNSFIQNSIQINAKDSFGKYSDFLMEYTLYVASKSFEL